MWAGPQATTPAPRWSPELTGAGRRGPAPVSPQVSPRTLSRAHVTPVPSACRPSVLPPATSALPGPLPRPVAPEAPRPRQAGRDATGPAALTRRGRGRPRPAERGRLTFLRPRCRTQGPGGPPSGGSGLSSNGKSRTGSRAKNHIVTAAALGWSASAPGSRAAERGGAGRGRGLSLWAEQTRGGVWAGSVGGAAGKGTNSTQPEPSTCWPGATSYQVCGPGRSPKLSAPLCPYI